MIVVLCLNFDLVHSVPLLIFLYKFDFMGFIILKFLFYSSFESDFCQAPLL